MRKKYTKVIYYFFLLASPQRLPDCFVRGCQFADWLASLRQTATAEINYNAVIQSTIYGGQNNTAAPPPLIGFRRLKAILYAD